MSRNPIFFLILINNFKILLKIDLYPASITYSHKFPNFNQEMKMENRVRFMIAQRPVYIIFIFFEPAKRKRKKKVFKYFFFGFGCSICYLKAARWQQLGWNTISLKNKQKYNVKYHKSIFFWSLIELFSLL